MDADEQRRDAGVGLRDAHGDLHGDGDDQEAERCQEIIAGAVERVYLFGVSQTGRFLRQLSRDVLLAGGRFEVRRFAGPAEIAALPERLVFNCTGLGARELFGDTELVPIRGQLAVLLPQPEVRYAFTGDAGYMFPRADGILLGGTFERGVEEAVTEPEAIARIVASHGRLFGAFRCTA